MNIGKLKRSTQIAIMTGAGSGAVEKTASGTSPLTLSDSVAGNIHSITVKGHSEVVDGAIKSIGDAGWGVVDLGTLEWDTAPEPVAGHTQFRASITATIDVSRKPLCSNYPIDYVTVWESLTQDKSAGAYYESSLTKLYIRIVDTAYTDATTFKSAMSGVLLYYPLADTTGATPTLGITSKDGAGQGTAATITTGLPLRSVSDSIYDTLDNDKVVKKCAEGDLSTYTWTYLSQYGAWQTNSLQNIISAPPSNDDVADPVITENGYTMSKWSGAWADKIISVNSSGFLVIVDSNLDENTPPTGNIVYALATPTETPLTSAETTALEALKTYDPTTVISITDNPSITVKYMGKRAARTAPKKRTNRKKKS